MTGRFRGRDDELAGLSGLIADAVAGHGAVVAIEGVAGIGKSRLVFEAVAIARRNGVRVAAAAAAFPGEPTPLGVLLRALGEVIEPGELDAHRGRPDERLWVLQELEARLEAAALEAPLLIALDDVHWADPQSLDAVARLAAALAALPVVWLVAYRPTELDGRLEQLRGDRIRLQPLAPEAVAAIVRDTVRAEPGPRLLSGAHGTGGNPHALAEFLAGALEEDLLTRADGTAELASAALPARVRDHMRDRLARLSPPAREVVEAAAVLGRRSEPGAVAALVGDAEAVGRGEVAAAGGREAVGGGDAAGRDAADGDHGLVAALDELARADLLRVEGEALTFGHDLVHAAVLDTLDGERRRALERRAVDVMLARGATPAAVGSRLAAAATAGDARATALLLDAARELGPTDPAGAADLSRRGYELCADDDPSRAGLAAETTLLLNAANRGHEAREFAATTLDGLLSPVDQAELLLQVAWMFTISPADQVAAAEQGLALDGIPDPLRARLYAALIVGLGTAGRPEDAADVLPEALAVGRRVGGAQAEYDNATAEGFVLIATGRYAETMELIEAGTAAAAGDPMKLWLWQHWRSDILVLLDRIDEAMPLLVQEVANALRTGQAWDAQLYEQRRGRLLFLTGQTLEALAVLEGLYDAGDGTDVPGPDATAIVGLGRAAIHAGDSEQTRVATQLARKMLGASVPEVCRQGALLLALLGLAEDDEDQLRAGLGALTGDGGALHMPTVLVDPAIGPYVVRAALRADDTALARRAVEWQERLARLNPGVVSIAGAVLHARALLHGAPVQALAETVATLRESPRPPLLASAVEDLGVAHARAGDDTAAIAALDEALRLWSAFDSSWDAARVRRRLRRLGVQRRPAAGARTDGWEQLTESEMAVARLVASGLTNREAAGRLFVSPHTVSTHLRRAFAKLGIRSRVELVHLVAEQSPALPWDKLTPAETRVAELVAAGLSNQAVAQRLVVSTNTVTTHLRRIYAKLGVRTRTELAAARSNGHHGRP
ncbi:AAA family ATPase [Solirubrobacter sp. CPCC 204708]|nr:AAA family ATPase [Solirubrobacter deserti]